MIRILISVAVLFAAVFAFDRLGAVPVSVTVAWPTGTAAPPLRVIVVGALVFAALSVIGWRLVSLVWRSPQNLRGFFAGRRRDRGYRALSRGMIAVGSGDFRLAQREAVEAGRYLDREPLVMLLDAQAAQLEGRSDSARSAFNRMLADPGTRLLGLRGLFIEATRAGELEAARQYAAEAHKLSPGIPWAGTAMMEYLSADRDWAGALAVLDTSAASRLVGKAETRRLRAVLLTARALEAEDGEPDKARSFALEAHRIAPDFVPATVVAARCLTRQLDARKAAKVIETTWKLAPHPELAEVYLHVRTGDSAIDRLKRARMLSAAKPHHVEGALAIARAALDAREFTVARDELSKALRQAPTQRVCLMMAELEETESGDPGRVREWLGRAVRAPRDEAWTADGVVLDSWQPSSPVTGRLDAVEWKVPVASDSGVTELDGSDLAELAVRKVAPPAPPSDTPPPDDTAIVIDAAPVDTPASGGTAAAATQAATQPAASTGNDTDRDFPRKPPDDPGPANGRGLTRSLTPDPAFH
ncbi:heme biosynthesis protein HemY [Oryzibacter oryziterrae]|uniref:heme biosynthesis protein HemY n=1 Tax=Oryzibacter oryziterrae TaxID=2766474 RepID=UPI001F2D0790|nr:heme biosynthesis HemY N-terminal domain-containing protein [Oryzibacter oryziterrae]